MNQSNFMRHVVYPSVITKFSLAVLSLGIAVPFATLPIANLQAAESKKPATARPASPISGVILLGDDGPIAIKTDKNDPRLNRAHPAKAAGSVSPKRDLNAELVRFCRARLGRRVGNGQCSELAVYGLPAVGAKLDFNNLWGSFVCQFSASGGKQRLQLGQAGYSAKNRRLADVRPGDIIQYENVKFERHWDNGYSFQIYPHHTSIISHVSKDGRTYKVFEQNVDGKLHVVETTLFIPEFTEGTMRISRPIPR